MRVAVLMVALFLLGLATAVLTGSPAAPAQTADEVLLETLTIDATADSSKTGTVTLSKGTLYHLQVDGTMTVDGPLRHDALYCYGGRINQPDCQPPQHQPVTPTGIGLFAGTGSSTLRTRIDSYMTPDVCCASEAPYQGSHGYNVPYYPDLSGKLRLQTRGGTANCSTTVCPETTTGSFTVKIYGPAPPTPTTTTTTTPPPTTTTPPPPPPTDTAGTTPPTTTTDGGTAPTQPPFIVSAGEITGEVAFRLNDGGEWQELKPGQEVPQGAEIFTGVDSKVVLRFADGSTFEVDHLTQILVAVVVVKENRKDVAIRLVVGQLNAEVKKETVVDTNFEVQTPTATTSVRGTRFSVFYDPVAKVTVVTTKEGLVEVRPARAGLPTTMVPAGKELAVTARSLSKLTKPGQSDARGGIGRQRALALVLDKLAAATKRCKLSTPRSKSVASTKAAPKGWLVSVRVAGKAKGKSSWRVTGRRVQPANAVAKRIARGCR